MRWLVGAGRKLSSDNVKKRIKHQTEKYSREFQYLAAIQDAFEAGTALEDAVDNCVNFNITPASMARSCMVMCEKAMQGAQPQEEIECRPFRSFRFGRAFS